MFITAASLAAIWGAAIAFTGGIDVRLGSVALHAHDPWRALGGAALLLAAWAVLDRAAVAAVLERPTVAAGRLAPWLAAAASVAATAMAIRYGAFVAGGADSYGYLSEAYGWVRGPLPRPLHVPLELPTPSSDWLQTPLGYWPGTAPHTIVPSYPPGLPWLMALAILVAGPIGPYLIVPLSAGLFVWASYVLARRTAGPIAGAAAALLAATSPVASFLSLWPMSDVPSAAIWTGAAACMLAATMSGTVAAGLLAALGVLVRPNLAPLTGVLVISILLTSPARGRWLRAAIVAGCAGAAAVVIALLNARWYGSPLLSGYGTPSALYSVANVGPNLRHYVAWIVSSQSVLVLLVPLAGLAAAGRGRTVFLIALFAAVLLCYLTYERYDQWWYLRFLLPGFGALFAATACGLAVVWSRVPRPWGPIAASALFAALIVRAASFTAAQQMYGPFMRSEHKYVDAGDFIARTAPADAVYLAMQHSGTIRYYGGRHTLRYDLLDRGMAKRIGADLEHAGLHPYLAIEDAEADDVRRVFGVPGGSSLPWPVVARLNRHGGFTILDLATRPSGVAPVAIEPATSRYEAPRERR